MIQSYAKKVMGEALVRKLKKGEVSFVDDSKQLMARIGVKSVKYVAELNSIDIEPHIGVVARHGFISGYLLRTESGKLVSSNKINRKEVEEGDEIDFKSFKIKL